MPELRVDFDAEAAGRLEPVRKSIIAKDCDEVVRNAVGTYVHCMPRVVGTNAEMCLVDPSGNEAVATIDMLSESKNDGEQTATETAPGQPFSVSFDEEYSGYIEEIARLVGMTSEEVVHESCRLYRYVVKRVLDENLVFGFLDNLEFRYVAVPGLCAGDKTVLH